MSHQPSTADTASPGAPVVAPVHPDRPFIGRTALSAFSAALRVLDYETLASELDVGAAWFAEQLADCVGVPPTRLRCLLRGRRVSDLARLLTRASGYFELERVFAEDEDLPRLRVLAEQAARVASALEAAPFCPRRRGKPWAIEAVLDEEGRGALALPHRPAMRA